MFTRADNRRWAGRRALGYLWCAATTLACTGNIGEPSPKEVLAGAVGPGPTTGTTQGGTGGGGSTVGTTVTEGSKDPGRVTMHRLNRAEYDNTVRDLLGVSTHPAADFPADDHSYGFDNIADALTISPLQTELYEKTAEDMVELSFGGSSSPVRDRFFTCNLTSADCPRTVIERFATQAWRRPAEGAEIDRLISLTDVAKQEGGSVEDGVKLALRAVLVSPHFTFRVEVDQEPAAGVVHALSEYELASRLSYFLWSSMPDDELFASAKAGTLHEAATLRAQVARMLQSDKAASFVDNFAGQWLYTRALENIKPDKTAYPTYTEALALSMASETKAFFHAILDENRPVEDILTANFSFVDAPLAKHYGIPAPENGLQKVDLTGTARGGLLAQASLLAVTSYPARTSPVKRGKWVLTQLLCSEPPPPPPNVGALPEGKMAVGTLRQRLEEHRANPQCASCHKIMDPIGFGLENFDSIGGYRTEDEGATIDASGQMPDGKTFTGAHELASIISQDPRLDACVSQQLFTYGLGRGPMAGDQGYLEGIVATARKSGFHLQDLLIQIVTSEPFLLRRGELPGDKQ